MEIVPTKPKEIGKVLVLGTGVVWGYPLLAGVIAKIPVISGILAFEIPIVKMTAASIIAAGLAASLIQYAIVSLWK